MTINNEDLILLKTPNILIHLMVVILHNRWVREVTLVDRQACRVINRVVWVAMITMEGKEVMHLIIQSLSHILLLFLGMPLALPQPLWVHLHHSLITTMDSHMVQIMGIIHHMPSRVLSRAMGTDMKMGSMKIMLQCRILMEDTEILSLFTLRAAHNQVIPNHSNMVSRHHTACHPKYNLNPTALQELVNQEMCLTKALFHQPNHIVNPCHINNSINIHRVEPCSKPIHHMALHLQLMGIINHHLHLVLAMPNKVSSQFLVMLSLLGNRLPPAMGR